MLTFLQFLSSKISIYLILVIALGASHFYVYKRGEKAAEERFTVQQASEVQKAVEKADKQAKDELNKALNNAKVKSEIEKKAIKTKTKIETIIKEKIVNTCNEAPVELTDELNKLIESVNSK
jgi:uncharacterized protein YpuA (DUF1002 family)